MIQLPYGCTVKRITIPPENLLGVYSPSPVEAVPCVKSEVQRALANPIGSQTLEQLAHNRKNAVIIADDNTRLTPTRQILPPMLDRLNRGGIPDARISVIIALGTHRDMTEEEMDIKFGREVMARVAVRNHSFRDPSRLINLGTTPNGTPISINKEAFEADLVLGVGSIVPHHIAGFSGGAKIVQPGVSGEETTGATHLLSVNHRRSYLGILDNPVRRELNEIASRVGLTAIFNTVLNRDGGLVEAFFGHPVQAFLAGAETSARVFTCTLPHRAPIVLASSYPCDLEFWQAHKALYAADRAAKKGGVIILVTPCPEGISKSHKDITELTPKTPDQLRQMLTQGLIKNKVAAALAIAWGQIRERQDIYLVSDGIAPADARKLGFTPFSRVEDALARALETRGPHASIAVLTHAPDMLPVVKPPSSL